MLELWKEKKKCLSLWKYDWVASSSVLKNPVLAELLRSNVLNSNALFVCETRVVLPQTHVAFMTIHILVSPILDQDLSKQDLTKKRKEKKSLKDSQDPTS